ncbi:unnamed protein product [Parnassius apollo]|uniref:(apollo) hypothetical protein n=1 Tax=Parnassius apollo TaxID=110799 RepID=A0A8S3WCK0_PARAO|nr:unnamed protein product [Parnassius apollo]
MEWEDEKVIKLIELYRSKQLLWDPKHSDYKLHPKRFDAFNDIATELSTSVTEVERKTHYYREKKCDSSNKSGAGTEEIYEKCLTLLQDQANTISEGLPAFGHRSICFTCGNSILRATRTYSVTQDRQERNILVVHVPLHLISRLERVCAACWRSATREFQRRDQHDSNRPSLSEAILPDVLTTLSPYATGSYQKPVGMSYLHGLCQASVSNAVKEVTMALNKYNMLKKYIHFPGTLQERQAIINGFLNKYDFPGCLGCINSTHVAMIRPTEHEERFFNRKHYHSRNVQITCDSDLNIINIDASYGGATHDAHIWKNSQISQHLLELHNRGEAVWSLGDFGYPLRPWLLTPIVNAEPGSAYENYTNMHCLTRNTVERCIGVLKARWRCLLVHRVLHYNHHMVAKIINACAVLHNICNRHRLAVLKALTCGRPSNSSATTAGCRGWCRTTALS